MELSKREADKKQYTYINVLHVLERLSKKMFSYIIPLTIYKTRIGYPANHCMLVGNYIFEIICCLLCCV